MAKKYELVAELLFFKRTCKAHVFGTLHVWKALLDFFVAHVLQLALSPGHAGRLVLSFLPKMGVSKNGGPFFVWFFITMIRIISFWESL